MKSFIIFASCFTFLLAQIVTADDFVQTNPAGQRAAHPPATNRTSLSHAPAVVHTSTVAGHNQLAAHPNPDIRRNNSAFAQPISRAPLAMNVQSPLRNLQMRQRPEQPAPTQKVSLTPENVQRAKSNRQSFFDALKRCRHERHDSIWWRQHCRTIVFVNTAYYYLDSSYWYPAYGYDPAYNYYDYDGPIYTYGDLLPDQVIANVQRALQEMGYYLGPVTGSLGPATRAALANYQRDYGLVITGAIDESTVALLGLN